MVTKYTPEERAVINQLVEKQMKWRDLPQRIEAELGKTKKPEELKKQLGPYILISRAAGAGGGTIGKKIGEKLGWPVLDRNLIGYIAEHFDLEKRAIEALDETHCDWVRDTLGTLLSEKYVSESTYLKHLGQVMMLTAYQGEVVIVGRGGQYMLPRENGLAVRVVANKEDRIRHMEEDTDLPRTEAQRLMEERDRGRMDFVQRNFRSDIENPEDYDLVVNTSTFTYDEAADVIIQAFKARKFQERNDS